ncbi:SDR family oxidoreductase [Alteribacter natronophilus]|uniref:SDR family oxidoreductase n=1 Tax=Alteribacter natronophilus TaxID=2583810 RepID=UPI00110EAFAB|nr:SDR family oxidoreductase [Alteribacter natronophilus]TMW71459.1 SDR family oxidoreductase [Alteribacter natronophilus]
MEHVSGKVVVVTGASSGIGEAIAFRAAEQKADVVLAARRTGRLEELKNRIESATGQRVLVAETDVTDRSQMEALVEKTKNEFGKIDVLVNNAGVMLLSFMAKDKVDEWEKMVDVNIKGVLFGVHAALPSMLEQDSGHIINVSSVAGHEVFASSSVYSATKYAVRALSMGLEKELSRTGVRVTNISPGAVESELAEHITDEDILERFKERAGEMKKLQADDIANAVLYAVSQPPAVNVNEVTVRPLQK